MAKDAAPHIVYNAVVSYRNALGLSVLFLGTVDGMWMQGLVRGERAVSGQCSKGAIGQLTRIGGVGILLDCLVRFRAWLDFDSGDSNRVVHAVGRLFLISGDACCELRSRIDCLVVIGSASI